MANDALFLSDGDSLGKLRMTVFVTGMVRVLVTAICLPIAIYLRVTQGPSPAVVQMLVLFPLVVPSIIVAYPFIRTLGPNGFRHPRSRRWRSPTGSP